MSLARNAPSLTAFSTHPPTFLDDLLDRGLLIETGVDGVYGRGAAFEGVVEAVDRFAGRCGAGDAAEVMRFPSVMSRAHFERSGYMNGFPQLAGTVHCFCGDERGHRDLMRCLDAGDDWTSGQKASEVVLTPAACYPVYPVLARRGRLPPGGARVDVRSECFRHEPSREPTRLQTFRMREFVRVGGPDDAVLFRKAWLTRGMAFAEALGLPATIDVANDPFFGRAGTLKADGQRSQELKFELLVPVNDGASPTACLSFNYHLDHFGRTWDLREADGSIAHTACVGFGLERIALALFRHHGLDTDDWSQAVRTTLWP